MLVISNPLFGEPEWIQMWLQFKLYQVRTLSVLFIVLATGKSKYRSVHTDITELIFKLKICTGLRN